MRAYSARPSAKGCASKVPMHPRRLTPSSSSSSSSSYVFHVTNKGAEAGAEEATEAIDRDEVDVAGVEAATDAEEEEVEVEKEEEEEESLVAARRMRAAGLGVEEDLEVVKLT